MVTKNNGVFYSLCGLLWKGRTGHRVKTPWSSWEKSDGFLWIFVNFPLNPRESIEFPHGFTTPGPPGLGFAEHRQHCTHFCQVQARGKFLGKGHHITSTKGARTARVLRSVKTGQLLWKCNGFYMPWQLSLKLTSGLSSDAFAGKNMKKYPPMLRCGLHISSARDFLVATLPVLDTMPDKNWRQKNEYLNTHHWDLRKEPWKK